MHGLVFQKMFIIPTTEPKKRPQRTLANNAEQKEEEEKKFELEMKFFLGKDFA